MLLSLLQAQAMRRVNNTGGRYYITGPRADNRTGATSSEMVSLALTFALRDRKDGVESTYYVRDTVTEKISSYVQVVEGENRDYGDTIVQVHHNSQ